MNVDTQEFAAITEQVALHERRIAAFSSALVAIGEAGGIAVPDVLRPQLKLIHGHAKGRHTKPRGRLRSVPRDAA